MSWKTLDPTRTLHKQDCKMSFGRKDSTCPRCMELINGAKPRESWNADKIRREQQFSRELAAHDCKRANCSIVCTFGDW